VKVMFEAHAAAAVKVCQIVSEDETTVSSAIQTGVLHDGLEILEHGTHESTYGLVWLLLLLLFAHYAAPDGGQGLVLHLHRYVAQMTPGLQSLLRCRLQEDNTSTSSFGL